MTDYEEYQKKLLKLSGDVLFLSRNILLVKLRFLDSALHQLEFVPDNIESLSIDGQHLFYSPVWILGKYKNQKNIITRYFLHVVFHCIFRHMYGAPYGNRRTWDLACDIAVEASISDLNIQELTIEEESKQQKIVKTLREKIGILSAEKIYRYYLETGLTNDEIVELQFLFLADNHSKWYQPKVDSEDIAEDNVKTIGNCTIEKQMGMSDEDVLGENNEYFGGMHLRSSTSNQECIWKEISEHIQVDLETFYRGKGDEPGTLLQNIHSVNQEKYDYESFLRKFAVRSEQMKINDEEFDYIFYTYGLNKYSNMPLIEPLEYKEIKHIKEFVIAIDTSGSVAGEKVQQFVQKTYNILKSMECFAEKINLHIIQCDAEIQEHVKITSQREFDSYIENMVIHGLGGTDFRPVFNEVDKMIKSHELVNLKGLIYLTDGYGDFPKKKPNYQTAVIFIEDGYATPVVPSWAIRLVLHSEEIDYGREN